MAKIALSSYTLRIRDVAEHEDLPLGDVQGEDFLDLLTQYLDERQEAMWHDQDEQRLLKVTRWSADGRAVSGLIETGDYGYESSLYDVERDRESYRRSAHEAELLPFYFYLSLPEHANEGLVILQRFQNFGIRTVLHQDLSMWLQHHPDLRVHFNALAVGEAWKEQIDPERVKEIRFVRFDLPHEVASALELDNQEENIATVEYVVRANRRRSLPLTNRIREFMDGRREWNNLIEIDFDYNTVKIEVDFGGSRRTLELTHPADMKIRYDITEQVQTGEDGHPEFDSIDQVSRAYAEDLAERLGGGHA